MFLSYIFGREKQMVKQLRQIAQTQLPYEKMSGDCVVICVCKNSFDTRFMLNATCCSSFKDLYNTYR